MNRQQFLRFLMASKKKVTNEWYIKYGTKADYVVSNGVDNWIDTLLPMASTCKDGVIIEMDLEYLTITTKEINAFGAVTGSGSGRNVIEAGSIVGGKDSFYAYTSNGSWTITTFDVSENNRYKLKYELKNGLQIMYVDDVEVYRTTNTANITSDGIMTLFARNFNNTRSGYVNAKWYSFKMSKLDGTPIIDYMPLYVSKRPIQDQEGNEYPVGSYILVDNVKRNATVLKGAPLEGAYAPWWSKYGVRAAYVISNGTNNYIDTGVTIQNDLNIDIGVEYLKVDGTSEHLFGGVTGEGSGRRIVELGFINGGKLTYAYGQSWTNTTYVPKQDTPYKISAEFKDDLQIMYVNGTEEYRTTNSVNIDKQISMYLLSRNEFGTPSSNMATVKIRNCNITKPTGEVLLDYEPIYIDKEEMIDSNGRVYPIGSYVLVDNVTEKVTNLYGEPLKGVHFNYWWEEYGIRAEYIEGNGTQYIDTNIPAQSNLSVDMEFAYTDLSGQYYGFGFLNAGVARFNPIAVDGAQYGSNFGYVNEINFVPKRYKELDTDFHRIVFNSIKDGSISIDGDIVDTYNVLPDYYNEEQSVLMFSRSFGSGANSISPMKIKNCNIWNKNKILLKTLIPILVTKQFTDLRGVTHNVGDWIMVNDLKIRDVPTHIGKFTGKQLLDGRNPVMEGLTHWWDSESQSGTTWTPKIGNVSINTSDSWENGYFKKLPNNICETGQFNVDWSKGCTVDILYNQLAFPITGTDSQLWCLNNQSNQEWALHYTSSKRSSFYSPTLFNNSPRYGDNLIPLNDFTSDVFTYNGDTEINNYIDNKITTFINGNTVLNNRPGAVRFALNRLTSGTNNQTSLIKSIRIYDRELTLEEIENNRLYDLFVLDEPIYEELESIEANGSQYIDTGIIGDETTELGLEFALTSLLQQKIAGSRTSADSRNITFSYPTNASNNYFNIDFQNNANNRIDTDYPFILNRYYTSIASPTIMSINGYEQKVKNVTPFVTPTTLRIGDGYGLTYATRTMYGRIKHYWIKKGDYLIQDCIPVKLLIDIGGGVAGDIGMWDKINNKFYKSATSNSFIARPKTGLYEELEYCQADGRQYLLLPFTTSEVNYIKITDLSLTSTTQGCVVGALVNGNPTKRDYLPYHTEGGNLTLGKPSIWSESINVGINNSVDLEIIQTETKATMKIGNESVEVISPRQITNIQYAMFAYYFNNGYVRPLQGKIKELYVEYLDKKIHLKAVKLLENFAGGLANEIGYLDVENMTFYKSVTGTSFIAGPVFLSYREL